MKKLAKYALWSAAIIIMAVIYSLSAQPAAQSNELSEGFTKSIIDKNPMTKNLPENKKQNAVREYNEVMRKYAHFTLFLMLGLFVCLAMRFSFGGRTLLAIWLVSLGFCLAYAVFDEVHQIFIPGRSAQITDVLIDFSGSFLGSTVVVALRKR